MVPPPGKPLLVSWIALVVSAPVLAAEPPSSAEADEIARIERGATAPSSVAPAPAHGLRGSLDLLLIADSTGDWIMALESITGSLVNANLTPTDSVNLATPKAAVGDAAGNKVLVSDQIRDVVQRYGPSGYVGVFAPAGGANSAIVDNIPVGSRRGVYELPSLNLLVTNSTGVFEISRANTLVSTKLTGSISPQYIERASSLFPVEPMSSRSIKDFGRRSTPC